MLDVLELEKRWFRYRRRKLLPFLVTALILIIVTGGSGYLFLVNPESIKDFVPKKEMIVEKATAVIEANISTQSIPVIQEETDDDQNVLRPSLSFMYNIEDQVINFNNAKVIETLSKAEEKEDREQTAKITKPKNPVHATAKAPKKPEKPYKQVAEAVEERPAEIKTVEKTEPVKTVVISKENDMISEEAPNEALVRIRRNQISEDELNSIIKRFEKQKNPALSLFIAKRYYEMENYKEAYNYALETNRLNPDIEDSILIFSRSLVKLGNQEKAIMTLKAYLNKSNSTEASILLDEIEKGKFK